MDLKARQRERERERERERKIDVKINFGFILARLFPYGMLDKGGRDTAFKIM
jgi:hypothetical protein